MRVQILRKEIKIISKYDNFNNQLNKLLNIRKYSTKCINIYKYSNYKIGIIISILLYYKFYWLVFIFIYTYMSLLLYK